MTTSQDWHRQNDDGQRDGDMEEAMKERHHDKHSLAERLRHMADRNGRHEYTIGNYWNVCDEAADRIKELERELYEARMTLGNLIGPSAPSATQASAPNLETMNISTGDTIHDIGYAAPATQRSDWDVRDWYAAAKESGGAVCHEDGWCVIDREELARLQAPPSSIAPSDENARALRATCDELAAQFETGGAPAQITMIDSLLIATALRTYALSARQENP